MEASSSWSWDRRGTATGDKNDATMSDSWSWSGSTWVAETAPTVRTIPDLLSPQCKVDRRFARKTKPDPKGKEAMRQYVWHCSLTIITRKATGCPKFDGQYINFREIVGHGDPWTLKKKWISGWDATWWCTACWCRNHWGRGRCGPLDEQKDKVPMRFYLGIVTTAGLDALHHGSQTYCSQPRPGLGVARAEAQSDPHHSYAATDTKWRGHRYKVERRRGGQWHRR